MDLVIMENFFILFFTEIILFVFLNIMLIVSLYLKKNKFLINVNITLVIYVLLFFFTFRMYDLPVHVFDLFNFIFCLKLFLIFFYIIIIACNRSSISNFYKYEFILLVNFVMFGLFILISCKNFISYMLALEIYSYSSYVLVSYKTNSLLSTEGGLKYLIMSSLSSGLALAGICIIYWITGTLIFSEISELQLLDISENSVIWVGLLLIIISIFIKIGAAPFHLWYLDAYQDIDFWLLAFLSVIPKLCLIGFLIQLCVNINFLSFYLIKYVMYFIGMLSLFVSNIVLILQLNVKRLFLYYAVQGNAFIALILSTGYIEHFEAIFIYLIFYTITYLNLVLFCSVLKDWTQSKEQVSLYNYYNLLSINYCYSWNLLIIIFNLLAIPPFIFFGAKILILLQLNTLSYYIIPYMFLINIFTIFVYLRWIHLIFFYNDYKTLHFFVPMPYLHALVLSVLILFNTFGFLLVKPIFFALSNIWF